MRGWALFWLVMAAGNLYGVFIVVSPEWWNQLLTGINGAGVVISLVLATALAAYR